MPNMSLQRTVTRTRVGEYAQRGSRQPLNAGRQAHKPSEVPLVALCLVCQRRILFSIYRDEAGRYCSIHCFASNSTLAFCPDCLLATTEESPGSMATLNGCGTVLAGAENRCLRCHSVVQGKYFAFLYAPVFPRGKFRVLYQARHKITDPIRYAGRRLKPSLADPRFAVRPS